MESAAPRWNSLIRLVAVTAVVTCLVLITSQTQTAKTSKLSNVEALESNVTPVTPQAQECIEQLEQKLHQADDVFIPQSLWDFVPVAHDAVFGYPDETQEGQSVTSKLAPENTAKVPSFSRFESLSDHKVLPMKHAHALLYHDNTVVLVDTQNCHIKGLWLPSREGEVNPTVHKQLSQQLIHADRKKKKPCSPRIVTDVVEGKFEKMEDKSKPEKSTTRVCGDVQDRLNQVHVDTRLHYLWEHVEAATDAVLSYPDDTGKWVRTTLKEENTKNVASLNRFDWWREHKVNTVGRSYLMLYPDNTVVTLNKDSCKITGLYLSTDEHELNPNVHSALKKRALRADKKKKKPKTGPCSAAFVALGVVSVQEDRTQPQGELSTNMFEGDIQEPKSILRKAYNNPVVPKALDDMVDGKTRADIHAEKDGLTSDGRRFWPRGRVYYTWKRDISRGAKANLEWAMQHISARIPGVTFHHRHKQRNYIQFKDANEKCFSTAIGMKYWWFFGWKQSIGLSCKCGRGTAVHEIMHAMGFWHEQSRPDRDSWVNIHRGNIKFWQKSQFKKRKKINSRGSPYDYGSIMHYSAYAFSKNGCKTISKKRSGPSLGQRSGMSVQDRVQMNMMYPKIFMKKTCSMPLGGEGGKRFRALDFQSHVTKVCGRADKVVNRIHLTMENGKTFEYGSEEGNEFCTNFAVGDSCITEVHVYHNVVVNSVRFKTKKGLLSPRFGGAHGQFVALKGDGDACLVGVQGKAGKKMDQLSFCFA